MLLETFISAYELHGQPRLQQAVEFLSENSSTVAATTGTAIALYLALVRYLRFKYVRELRRKYPDPSVVLKDAYIAEEIYDITVRREFPGKYWLCHFVKKEDHLTHEFSFLSYRSTIFRSGIV